MTNIHLVITGPIRPNIDYINYITAKFRSLLNTHVTIFLGYWQNSDVDERLIENVDFKYCEKEPEDTEIFDQITGRTKQQKQMHPKIEHWTPRIYKMFYGIRKMVERIEKGGLIGDNEIVIRMRTDLHVDNCDIFHLNNLLNNVNHNTIYNRTRTNHTCDWFSISTYNTFKKIWWIENNDHYNNVINQLHNAEAIITYKCALHGINIMNIHNIISLSICREYKDENEKKLQHYG